MSKNKLTKGEHINMLDNRLDNMMKQIEGIGAFCGHLQQGVHMSMQTIDGQKILLNSLIDMLKENLSSIENFDTKLEEKFQLHVDKYQKELEEQMQKSRAEQEGEEVNLEDPDLETVDMTALLEASR